MTVAYNYETGYIKQILQGRTNVEICILNTFDKSGY